MVSIIYTLSPISIEHMSFLCQFLDPHLSMYHLHVLGGMRKAKQHVTNRQVTNLGQSLPMFMFIARDVVERLEMEARPGLCEIERCWLLATTHCMTMKRQLMVGASSSCGRAHDFHPIDLWWINGLGPKDPKYGQGPTCNVILTQCQLFMMIYDWQALEEDDKQILMVLLEFVSYKIHVLDKIRPFEIRVPF